MTQLTIMKFAEKKDESGILKMIHALPQKSGLVATKHPEIPEIFNIFSLGKREHSLATVKKSGVWILGPAGAAVAQALSQKGIAFDTERRNCASEDAALSAFICP